VVVDGGVDVGVAEPAGAAGGAGGAVGPLGGAVTGAGGGAAVDAPAAAVGDVAELLDVNVHQLAGPGHLIAAHRFTGDPIDVPEPVDPAADKDSVHRRGRQPDPAGDRHRPQPLLPAQVHDLAHDWLRRSPR
jgi:hypothetical protein